MSAPNRVDELRKRYHENPRRFFAPLANEYRKTGFVDRAILLCEKHLGEQPGNMNGLVVYGQCLFETGRLEEARQPFEAALGLDPENLIALRHLGDIARLGGDVETARAWYGKLLEFDRRNDEVIALLAEVGGGTEQAPASASHAPNIISVAGSVRVTTATDAVAMGALESPAVPTPGAPPTPTLPLPVVPPAPIRDSAATPRRAATPVDPSAKTVEVSAQPKPVKRASLLDVSFDFGEIGTAADAAPPPPAPEPVLPAEAAEYGFAATELGMSAEEELDTLDSLIEASPEGESLSAMPAIEGIEKAEFSADVSPLAGLEASEFTGGDVAPIDGLDPIEFRPPDRPSVAVEGLESDEFEPMGLEAIPDMGLEITHDDPFAPPAVEMSALAPADAEPTVSAEEAAVAEGAGEPAWPSGLEDIDAPPAEPDAAGEAAPPARSDARADARASVAGLPLLEPFGTPTPMATPTVSDLPLLPSLEEAETVPIDLEAVRRSMETPSTFVTETMAQVYVQQGHTDKAIEVYRQLVAQSPDDAELAARLRDLEAPPVEAPSAPMPARQTLGFDTPFSTEPIEEPAPANSMLKATSFDGISLSTPDTPSRGSAPVLPVRDSVASGPSAREFFARFAHRSLTPIATPVVQASPAAPESTSAPSAAGRLLSPLDELFGTGVLPEDEAAAHRLAGVGATSGPSGGSALDSLFGEGPSAPMPAETPRSSSATTPSRGTVPRASEKLRFDQFFASSTPVEGSAATPAPAHDAEPEPASDDASTEDGEPGEDDDLDQFQGWLRGLTS